MSNVDTPKILYSGPVHLVKTDTLPDVLLEGRIYLVESTGQQTLVLPGGETVEIGTPVPTTSIYQFREAGGGATDAITAGDWRDVPLATAVYEGISGASLAAGVVTLPAGTFVLEYGSGAYVAMSNTTPVQAQVRLYDVDADAEVSGSGGSMQANGEDQGSSILVASAMSRGSVVLTLSEETTIKMQIQVSVNAAYAPQSYTSQVCAELKITRI